MTKRAPDGWIVKGINSQTQGYSLYIHRRERRFLLYSHYNTDQRGNIYKK